MINNKKLLAIIPARGGSKGVPRKNIRKLAGKPLIVWTIEAGKQSKYIDRIIVSSEDEEILQVAKEYGEDIAFERPKSLAEDHTPGIDPVLHAIEKLADYQYVILLQPTSPLRAIEDIDGCIEKLLTTGASSCVSVTVPDKSPYWMYTLQKNGAMEPLIPQVELLPRRQDLPIVYALNGAVYIAKIDWLKRTKSFITEETIGYVMPKIRSYDIDTEEDFLWCEWIINKKNV
ncbi:acylneuraminate cytidylyltransferase family protein [Niallia circulans]|uniref:acylneuraminate cytidylyltransferase family protein n=1 Tax=Niallia circulans TaxID=1397 RepID=UPI003524CD77